MNFDGLILGLISFGVIGLFHPIVIKTEYYYGKKTWPVFLFAGFVLIVISTLIENTVLSAAIGITGFSSLWSIHELFEQEERVKKG